MKNIYPIVLFISAFATTQAATLFFDSFETDAVNSNPAGWTVSNTGGMLVTDIAASEGIHSLFITGDGQPRLTTQKEAEIIDISGGGDLTFSFDYAITAEFESNDGLQGFFIDFGAGYQTIVVDMGAPDGVNTTYTGTTITLPDTPSTGASSFIGYSITVPESYYSGVLGATTARLRYSMRSGSPGENMLLDNIVVTSVPEPSTYGLIMAIGGGLLVIARRRLRKS